MDSHHTKSSPLIYLTQKPQNGSSKRSLLKILSILVSKAGWLISVSLFGIYLTQSNILGKIIIDDDDFKVNICHILKMLYSGTELMELLGITSIPKNGLLSTGMPWVGFPFNLRSSIGNRRLLIE